jgi:hypothetical protein
MIYLVFKAATLRGAMSPLFLVGYLSGFSALWMTHMPAFAAETAPNVVAKPAATTPAASPAQIAEYQKQLAAYNQAQQQFHDETAAYWTSISQKRASRNAKRRAGQAIVLDDYVLTQPPAYTGPPAPVNPAPSTQPQKSAAPAVYIPVVADFLKGAADKFKFVPRKPPSEIAFKKAYASVASPAGILKDQAVRIYGFEAGGNGTYDVQAGLEYNRPGAHAISTALGYNQLLSANSVELLAEQGDLFVKSLTDKAAPLAGAQRAALTAKIQIVQQMIIVCKSVPDEWDEHVKLGNTPEGLGVHALNLDIDVGPLLQTQKLLNSIIYARHKGRAEALSAAALEMMNLSGDGNGFDMITVPDSWRAQVPTSNFFQQSGYEDNSVVIRNNVVSTLLAATNAKMDTESALPGAKDLAGVF